MQGHREIWNLKGRSPAAKAMSLQAADDEMPFVKRL
jgi:hypothetical protein